MNTTRTVMKLSKYISINVLVAVSAIALAASAIAAGSIL